MDCARRPNTGTGYGTASIILAVISMCIYIISPFLAKGTGGFGLIGVSFAPLIIVFAGWSVALFLNFVGVIFGYVQINREQKDLGWMGLAINIFIPFVVANVVMALHI